MAVGSGAFLLGMLIEITKAGKVLNAYLNFGRQEKFELSLYDLKLETIRNSIFACDIDPAADKKSFKPKPLPNLDCNIICGNSLIDAFEGVPLIKHSKYLNNLETVKGQGLLVQGEIDRRINELIQRRKILFHETDHARKEELRRRIRDVYDEIITEQLGKNSQLAEKYKLAAKISDADKKFLKKTFLGTAQSAGKKLQRHSRLSPERSVIN